MPNKMTYGDAQALKVLAAERMGLNPSCIQIAHDQLNGKPIHPMLSAQLGKAADEIHNQLASDENMVARANEVIKEIMTKYGFNMEEQKISEVTDAQLARYCRYTTETDGSMLRKLCAKHGWVYASDIPDDVVNYVRPFLLDAAC